MFDNIEYNTGGKQYVINGDAPDLIDDLSHKVLFSIEDVKENKTFSYNLGIAHQLWSAWNIDPNNEEQLAKVKQIYLEKAKRFIDSGKEEYLDITLTPVNTSKDLDEALNALIV
jgi:hypothetical protein